ncbi:MAG: alpha/beta hydrolase [Bacteroidia bacterium]|nr:alpha/beta hydrolase [Bacteroidia bacterium]NND12203.1 alpha/beta hydrolase [Flavobacteriaceae bacterium]NNK28442.1 alpha/beta hydrolase [Flavobacteriaceae bacterium]
MKNFVEKVVPKIIGTYLNTLSFLAPELAAEKALNLFSTPRKGRILDDQKKFLKSAIQHELEFNETAIMTYHWKGQGPTVLLAHGWESNAWRWHRLIKFLKKDKYNIVALDAPAHGQSGGSKFNALLYAEFMNEAAKHYQPKIIIGHSVGGMAAVFFNKNYLPEYLEKLVLIGAPSEFVNVFEGYTSMLGYSGFLKQRLNKLITDRFGGTPESFSTAKYLEGIKNKGLIIHDKQDKIIDYKEALMISKAFENAKLITTDGLGHSLHHDSVNKKILEFLNA